jgi:hypothetical protein
MTLLKGLYFGGAQDYEKEYFRFPKNENRC